MAETHFNQQRAERHQRRAELLAMKRAYLEQYQARVVRSDEEAKQKASAEREARKIEFQYWWRTRPPYQKLILYALGWIVGCLIWGVLVCGSAFLLMAAGTAFAALGITLAAWAGPPYTNILLPLGICGAVLTVIWLSQEVKLFEIWGMPVNVVNEILNDAKPAEIVDTILRESEPSQDKKREAD